MVLDPILSSFLPKDFVHVLVDSGYSLVRMTIGIIVSYIFAISYGVVAARNKKAEKIMMPILDILQSVPILGFFPAAIFFFIALFNQSWVGVEMAAIFLIFTSQAWNLAFAVYESVSSIPSDLEEASGSFGVKGWKKFKTLYLPAAIPKLIYNGILSWATGWYYLVAAELISIGSKQYTLPGIGSYLAKSTSAGDYQGTIFGLAVLVCIILFVDLILWKPLRRYAGRFKYESMSSEDEPHKNLPDPRFTWIRRNLALLQVRRAGLTHVIPTSRLRPIVTTVKHVTEEPKIIQRHRRNIIIAIIAVIAVSLVVTGWVALVGIASFPATVSNDLKKPDIASAASQIPVDLGYSLLRLLAAYLISVAWILPLALKLAGKPRSFGGLIFIMEIVASLPATALFPLIVLGTMNLPGGLELTSVILTMTGMQWYILFNVLGAVRSIPADLTEAAKAYNIKGWEKLKKLIFPAILPSFITGSITAWGGGWNALVLSEYITYSNKTMSVPGIGALMNKAAYEIGSVSLLAVLIIVMVAVVVGLNRTLWKRLYKIMFSKYRLDY
ncbi:MAG: ABC transporter permease subunit [Thaumarchaeota archaeon]|nr:ABC transporter permease subunit [Nitrososphaerota archaeon]